LVLLLKVWPLLLTQLQIWRVAVVVADCVVVGIVVPVVAVVVVAVDAVAVDVVVVVAAAVVDAAVVVVVDVSAVVFASALVVNGVVVAGGGNWSWKLEVTFVWCCGVRSARETTQAGASVLPMECHGQALLEHNGAGVVGLELAGRQG
jgi:hypothetical protein